MYYFEHKFAGLDDIIKHVGVTVHVHAHAQSICNIKFLCIVYFYSIVQYMDNSLCPSALVQHACILSLSLCLTVHAHTCTHTHRASVTTFTRSNQGFGEEEGLASAGTPMQAGMDEGARVDHGQGRQHAEMLGAAGILHRPEEEALSPQVREINKIKWLKIIIIVLPVAT